MSNKFVKKQSKVQDKKKKKPKNKHVDLMKLPILTYVFSMFNLERRGGRINMINCSLMLRCLCVTSCDLRFETFKNIWNLIHVEIRIDVQMFRLERDGGEHVLVVCEVFHVETCRKE